MNYSQDRTHAFTIETLSLDINGNTVRRLKFFRMDRFSDGMLGHYKTRMTNAAIAHLSNDEIIKVWG